VAKPIAGFDWDAGNRAKCQKHGVSLSEIESLFDSPVLIVPDPGQSQSETRLRAVGKTSAARYVFLVFTVRTLGGKRWIRPIAARYMHAKEIAHYEKENPKL
jgi:uncharacterized DUF497 family protein